MAYQAKWSAWLSVDERDRAQRFARATDRDRFRLSRGGLRYLLAQYLNCAPKALAFTYSHYGKPSLLHPATPLQFNLAHSGAWVVYGVSQCRWLGVDVEQLSERPYLEALIQRCLSPSEQVTLPKTLVARQRAFFDYWTVKEAHLKAIGLGLSYPMSKLEVGWSPRPHLICPAHVPTGSATGWTIAQWQPDDRAIAAVCLGHANGVVARRPFPLP